MGPRRTYRSLSVFYNMWRLKANVSKSVMMLFALDGEWKALILHATGPGMCASRRCRILIGKSS